MDSQKMINECVNLLMKINASVRVNMNLEKLMANQNGSRITQDNKESELMSELIIEIEDQDIEPF